MNRFVQWVGRLPAFIVGLAMMLALAIPAAALGTAAWSAYETHSLIASGKTPSAIHDAEESNVIDDLLCAFLRPALTAPKSVSKLLPAERAAILRDCPLPKEP